MAQHLRPLAVAPLLLVAAWAAAEVPQSPDPARFPAYHVMRKDLAGSGQPTAEGLSQLKALGFRTVVNLRTEKEGAGEERAGVESQGLRYVNVPIRPESFGLADVAAVRKVLDDPAAGPVLLHCASANRVGAVWAVIQAQQGRTLAEALAAGRAAGLHSPPMIDTVLRVLAPAGDAKPPTAPGAKP